MVGKLNLRWIILIKIIVVGANHAGTALLIRCWTTLVMKMKLWYLTKTQIFILWLWNGTLDREQIDGLLIKKIGS